MDNTKNNAGLKAKVQKLGSYLSSMVMPNIGAFIAWGVLTALFIPDGYFPNEDFAGIVGPMLSYLLPILIGYTGGKMVHGDRGAVVGAIATVGAIVGSDVTMFIGAMVMGPLGGWLIKKFDERFQDKIPSGFEMLVNNFSSGLIGFALALIAFVVVGPVVASLTSMIGVGVEALVQAGLLPLANILIEPAKVLFLNNALNHGIFTPLGSEQVAEAGKSILYLLETNPGPGLGVLLAFMFLGKGSAKGSAPGAAIIHFLGGIHEIYFPYVMMKPLLFLAVIAGGMTGTFVFSLFDAGLTGAASPGSIVAITAMTAQGSHLGVYAGVIASAIVSFLIAGVIIKSDRKAGVDDAFEEQVAATQAAKASSKGQSTDVEALSDSAPAFEEIDQIIFACDAGMGSSAMGASLLRKKVKSQGIDIKVTNSAINNLKDDSKTLVITQEELTNRARKQSPSSTHLSVENFLDGDRYDEILNDMYKKSDEPVVANEPVVEASSVGPVDYSAVKQVFVAYDGKVGASTMAASQLRNQFTKNGINVPVEAKDINDLSNDSSNLVIATPEVGEKVRQQYANVMVDTYDKLLNESHYNQLIEYFK
ncbi:PTS mannitol transporter subunit IICBA [Ruoffia tabacinasalis]|uniref:PTS mannitol transporter subunit IICBA n=1 Tax=Ruoffia tabacinasalis TaxID=87458 RepID=UPI003F9DEF9E